jgi:hypothetical protein
VPLRTPAGGFVALRTRRLGDSLHCLALTLVPVRLILDLPVRDMGVVAEGIGRP